MSTGDPTRKGKACDCITTITPARAQTLVNAGYETVGRYLYEVPWGTLDKEIKPGELDNIFNAKLTVFPIFQTTGDTAGYFNYDQGISDAKLAYQRAQIYGFKEGTTIYFAVDCDALDWEIKQYIIPHFTAINEQMKSFSTVYRVGIYGTRNVCNQVASFNLASTSFVSGMSTGWSGNLGFPLPTNWAFDQISTVTIGSGDGLIEIDNNMKSGKYHGESSVNSSYGAIYSRLHAIADAIPVIRDFFFSDITLGKEVEVFNFLDVAKLTVRAESSVSNVGDGAQVFRIDNGQVEGNFLAELGPFFMELGYNLDLEEFQNRLGIAVEEGDMSFSFYASVDDYFNLTYTINSTGIIVGEGVEKEASFEITLSLKRKWDAFDLEELFEKIGPMVATLLIVAIVIYFASAGVTVGALTSLVLACLAILSGETDETD